MVSSAVAFSGGSHPPNLQSRLEPYVPALQLHICLLLQVPRPISQGPGVDFGVSLAHSTEHELSME